ncbi:MAG TPA: alanine racemase [Vicinamibacterales bacterium]|nr:alanine racemase [Vicinamibacterales bacterium]
MSAPFGVSCYSPRMQLADLPTPQVLIDRPRLMRNMDYAQQLASSARVKLRPHAKTHKSPVIAKWQIDRGAAGVCCAKVGEAEVFAAAGIGDIRLPYPVNPSNAPRLLALMDRAKISIIVDHLDVARGWSGAMQRAGRTLDVLVKVDVGFHRCGIDPGGDALGFLQAIAAMPGLRLRGLLSHAGHGYHASSEQELCDVAQREAETLTTLRDRAMSSGIALEEISVGATPTLRFSVRQRGLTELRPGNYVYFDRTQVALGAATLDECALTVIATVVSKHPGRIILDCGSKTLTNDQARGITPAAGYGAVLIGDGESPRAIDESLSIERLSEEHATVRVIGATSLEPGDRVRVVPNHSCVVSNLVDAVRLVDGDRVIDTLPVSARGRIQ